MTQEEYYDRMVAALEAIVALMTPSTEQPVAEEPISDEVKIMDRLNYEMAKKTAIDVLGEAKVTEIENEIKGV